MSYGYDIKPLPREVRKYGFSDIFVIWFGAGISIAEFWAGAIIVASPLSLDLKTALLSIIIGHIIGNLLLSLIGVIGTHTSLPTMVISRKPLGLKGSYLVSILNYLQLIGWTAVMLIVGALAMNNVFIEFTGLNLYYLWIIILGVLVTLWSVIGPEKWRILEKASAIMLLLLILFLMYVLFTRYSIDNYLKTELVLDNRFWLATDLVIAMPVSWAPLIADYTRFTLSKKNSFWGSYIGYFISSSLFYFLGAFSNIALNQYDPISVIAFYGLGIPAMLIIVFSTTTTTFLDVYSAAITIKNIKPNIDTRKHIVYAGLLGTIVAILFPVEKYEWFLILIGGAFVSLTAIMIVDYLIDKHNYSPDKVLEPGKMFDKIALIIWSTGFIIFILLASPGLLGIYIPFFSELGSTMGSSMPTIILIAVLYTIYKKVIK
uniref:Putative hydroxymethylpyrimidine transporter CytX n=1 Tax=Staphylothermus marinus TaxID=2280 RepID=A0A7C4HCR9_STAMA